MNNDNQGENDKISKIRSKFQDKSNKIIKIYEKISAEVSEEFQNILEEF